MSNFLSTLGKTISSTSDAAKDHVAQAIDAVGQWKDKAKAAVVDSTVKAAETTTTAVANFILKDDLAGNFGEGLAEYQGKRVGVFVGAMLGQTVDVGLDKAVGKTIGKAVEQAPAVAGSIAKSIGKNEDAAKSAAAAFAQGSEKGMDLAGKGGELAGVGQEVHAARKQDAGQTVEALGKAAPKLIAMTGAPGEALSVAAAGTLTVLTDADGQRDVSTAFNNLSEDLSAVRANIGGKAAEAAISATALLPDALCSDNLKRLRDSRKMASALEPTPSAPAHPKA